MELWAYISTNGKRDIFLKVLFLMVVSYEKYEDAYSSL